MLTKEIYFSYCDGRIGGYVKNKQLDGQIGK
jgi:hypothetical protein